MLRTPSTSRSAGSTSPTRKECSITWMPQSSETQPPPLTAGPHTSSTSPPSTPLRLLDHRRARPRLYDGPPPPRRPAVLTRRRLAGRRLRSVAQEKQG
ncbi:hypothetical protein [Methanoculleus chikugoensis]|uniref:hypothetical protein n=1 Tax=Methanoculleus chikugoensis TaxID=118126 RepID=UPI001FB1B9D0|nr:hypothetical protein [Methanoculleus chikugoensis]